jgi:hypothetical protein
VRAAINHQKLTTLLIKYGSSCTIRLAAVIFSTFRMKAEPANVLFVAVEDGVNTGPPDPGGRIEL